jgi:alkaline phosphatase
MRSLILIIALAALTGWISASAQSPQSIFAHNDYLKPNPFHAAYQERVGYIEVDVFLKGNELLVAHTRKQLEAGRNIEGMYLKPLLAEVLKNDGFAYPDSTLSLRLMIDIKTDVMPTLRRLVEILSGYPDLTVCKNLYFTISGNMPAPRDWAWVPPFISFDGRPGISYDEEQLKRVPLVSANFNGYSSWKGKREMDPRDRARLAEAILTVHLLGKPVRFWASPDTRNAWEQLAALGVDVINTDDVKRVVEFLREREVN